MNNPVAASSFHAENGSLYVFDTADLPFRCQRIFFIKASQGDVRGDHAHRACQQFLVVIDGEVRVTKRSLEGAESSALLRTGLGILLPPMTWSRQYFLTKTATMLVLCDREYDEEDYIREPEEFNRLMVRS